MAVEGSAALCCQLTKALTAVVDWLRTALVPEAVVRLGGGGCSAYSVGCGLEAKGVDVRLGGVVVFGLCGSDVVEGWHVGVRSEGY